jgi:hypothetical protein
VIFDRVTVRENFSGILKNPCTIILTTKGINISTIRVNRSNMYSKIENIFLENRSKLSLLFVFTNSLEKIGTKAELKAPSAKIFLKKLGNLRAVKNTSDSVPVPKYLAKNISLTKPNILDNKVPKLTINVDFKKFILLNYNNDLILYKHKLY